MNNVLTGEIGASSSIDNYKIVVLGDISVGKTSILSRFRYGTFEPEYMPTLGIDFFSKNLFLEDKTIRLILWDTAGQERFRSLNKLFIKDSQVVIFVYDVTKKKTFEELGYWVNFVQQILPENVIFGLVGNKMDLINVDENNEKINHEYIKGEEGKQYSDEIGAIFCETSAKDDIEGFEELVRQLMNKCILQRNNIEKEWEIMILDKSPTKKKKNKLC